VVRLPPTGRAATDAVPATASASASASDSASASADDSASGSAPGELAPGDVAGLARRFADACDGPVDLVLDPLYGVPAAAAARTLRPGGRLVNLGSAAAETCPLDSSTLRSRSLRILGYTNNELSRERRAAAVTYVAEQSAAGRLSVTHEVAPLKQAPQAWERQASGTADGRIVLAFG
ncbi:zinc-binding dehydrogenase, partial [Nonomuraea maheshkhaliensis]|uniref:zinc-binding dehydrogenase n=1 Tax=Nonomuraea maheshkhaliensis TaxID=419590 RepID=UPI0031F7CAA5